MIYQSEGNHQSEGNRDAHRAIGRYVVEFSGLVADMRIFIERQLAGDDPMLARLALGTTYADATADAFFAICERLANPDDEERGVGVRLKVEVKAAITERNDFAHGDWKLGYGDDPSLWRMKSGRKAGPWVAKVRPVPEIDAMSDALNDLRHTIIEYAWLCAGIHPLNEMKDAARVRDVFRLRDHRVLRIGRYASDWPGVEEDG